MGFTQQEKNNRLKELIEFRRGKIEIDNFKKTIDEKDKRILELETEIKILMRMLKGKI